MANFTAIETQEQLDAIIGERLKRSDEKWAKKFEGYVSPEDFASKTAELESQIKGLTAEKEESAKKYADFDKQIAERDASIKKYEIASVKSKVAHEKGLNYEAIQFLQGDDEESISASADGLKNLMGNSFVPPVAHEPKIDDGTSTKGAFRNLASALSTD